jgi:hypothetical protein
LPVPHPKPSSWAATCVGHFSRGGNLHGGAVAAGAPSSTGGLDRFSVDTIAPIPRCGVLLDVAGHEHTGALPEDFIIPEHLDRVAPAEGVEVGAGDVVLLRTGWARFWEDAAHYICFPGNRSRHGLPGKARRN